MHPFAVFAGGDDADLRRPAAGFSAGARGYAGGSGPGLLEEAEGGMVLIEDAHRLHPELTQRLAAYLATARTPAWAAAGSAGHGAAGLPGPKRTGLCPRN